MVLAAALLAACSKPVMANDNLIVSKYLNTNYAVISAALSPQENYKLFIISDKGEILYRSNLDAHLANYQKLFDLSQLKDGKYTVMFDGKAQDVKTHFTIEDQKLISYVPKGGIEMSSISTTQSFIRQEDELIYVTHINPELKNCYLSIYDSNGDSIYSSTLPKKATYSGLYKIDELPKGDYTLVLTTGSKVHTYEFQK